MFLSIFTLAQGFDGVAIATIGIFAIVGAARGALRGILRIVAGLAAWVVGRFASPIVAPTVGDALLLRPEIADVAVTVAVAAIVLVALSLIIHRFDEMIQKAKVPVFDSILGLFLGTLFGAGLAASVLILTMRLPAGSPLSDAARESHAGKLANKIYSFRDKL